MTLMLALLAAVAAQEKVTLKFQPKQGDKLTQTKLMEMTVVAQVKAGEQQQEFTFENRNREKTIREYAEVSDGKLRKIVLDCREDVSESKAPGQPDFRRQPNPLHERRVVISSRDGKVVLEGADDLDVNVRRKLDLEPDNFTRTFPADAVAVGETWEISGEKLKGVFGDDELKEGKISFKLTEVREIDRRRCALLTARIELRGTGENNVTVGFKLDADIVVWLDRGYTLSVKAKGTATMKTESEEFTLNGEGPVTFDQTTVLE